MKLIKIMSKNVKNRGGLISALKPGPVVPPGIEKTPDQAARISQSGDFGHLSDILAILRGVSFFTIFVTFSLFWFFTFDDFHFLHFVTFSLFLFFWFLLFFDFVDFWWFLVIFCCWHCFWSIIVSVLGASIMTHFSPSISALPLSPLLVVKLWPIFTLDFDVNFWSNFGHFLSNWGDFSEKLDFAIKNWCFWSFFDTKFDQFLVIFVTFLGSFLGFLGGYPSPSISAPLVVKKCLKLYIYIIG